MDRSGQTGERMAKAFVAALIGDAEWTTPGGTPAYTYFQGLDLDAAHKAYQEVHQLPEGMRMRDLMERLVEDGRMAG